MCCVQHRNEDSNCCRHQDPLDFVCYAQLLTDYFSLSLSVQLLRIIPSLFPPCLQDTKPTNGIIVNINGVDVQFGGASGTSNFASKVRCGSLLSGPDSMMPCLSTSTAKPSEEGVSLVPQLLSHSHMPLSDLLCWWCTLRWWSVIQENKWPRQVGAHLLSESLHAGPSLLTANPTSAAHLHLLCGCLHAGPPPCLQPTQPTDPWPWLIQLPPAPGLSSSATQPAVFWIYNSPHLSDRPHPVPLLPDFLQNSRVRAAALHEWRRQIQPSTPQLLSKGHGRLQGTKPC